MSYSKPCFSPNSSVTWLVLPPSCHAGFLDSITSVSCNSLSLLKVWAVGDSMESYWSWNPVIKTRSDNWCDPWEKKTLRSTGDWSLSCVWQLDTVTMSPKSYCSPTVRLLNIAFNTTRCKQLWSDMVGA